MKTKLEAGASLEFVTQDEIRKVLDEYAESWRNERLRGVKWRKFSAQSTGNGTVFQIGGDVADRNQNALGPDPGFVWSVTRLCVSGPGINLANDAYSVFVDEASPTRAVLTGQFNAVPYPVGTVVLMGGETLVLQGGATGTAGGGVFLSGQAAEVPVSLSWMLLGR